MVERDQIVVRRKDLVAREVGDELFVLDVEGRQLHRISGVGVRMWELIERPVTPARMVDVLVDEFEVARDRVEKDCLSFLDRLAALGLLKEH